MIIKNISSYSILFLNGIRVISFFLFYKLILFFFGQDFSSSYAIIDSYTILLGSIAIFGYNTSVLRLFKDFGSNTKFFLLNYFKISSLIFCLSIGLLFIFNIPEKVDYFYYLPIFIILFVLTSFAIGLLKAFDRVVIASIFENLFPLFLLIVTFLIIGFNFPKDYVFYGWIVVKATFLIGATLFALKYVFLSKEKITNKIQFNNITIVALPIFISTVSITVLNELPTIYLGLFSQPTETLSFKLGMKVAMLLWIVQYSFYNILFPKIPKLYKENKISELAKIVRSQSYSAFQLNLLLFFIIVIFGEQILYIISNSYNLDYLTLIVLASTILLNSLFGPIDLLFQSTKYEKIHMKLMIVLILIFFTFIYFLGEKYGSLGIAINYFVVFFIRNCFARWFFLKEFKHKITLI